MITYDKWQKERQRSISREQVAFNSLGTREWPQWLGWLLVRDLNFDLCSYLLLREPFGSATDREGQRLELTW